MKRLLSKSLCLSLVLTYTAVFVLQDASFAMHSGSSDSASNFSSDVAQARAAQNFQTDLFTGQATTAIPIFVPPGRKGVQPALALTYSSSGQNGWAGVGWNLEIGSIERSIKNGPPQFNSNDIFVFSFQGVRSELIQVAGNEYRPKSEAGSFLKFQFNAPSWEAWDKNGTRYSFGTNVSSRQESGSGPFKWHLDRVTDTHGNYMTLSYGLQKYLENIAYTGNDTTGEAPTHTINFYKEPRPDAIESYAFGMGVSIAYRLKQIDVSVGQSLARRYILDYAQSSRTSRSLLTRVTEYGTDGATSLPAVQFAYLDGDDTTFTFRTADGNSTNGDNAWNIQTGAEDFFHSNEAVLFPNGDFIPLCGGGGGHATFGQIYTGQNGSANSVTWTMNPVNGRINWSGDRDTHLHAWTYVYVPQPKTLSVPMSGTNIDWAAFHNGQLIQAACNRTWEGFTVNLNAGWNLLEFTDYNQNSGYGSSMDYDLAQNVGIMASEQFIQPQLVGDFNGDGVSDLANFESSTGTIKVSLSCSVSCTPATAWITGFGNSTTIPLVGDYNRDGKSDIAMFQPSDGSWRVALSNGQNAFLAPSLWLSSWGGPDHTPIVGDFNGDGYQDIGTFNTGTADWRVAFSNGTAFVTQGTWLTNWGGGPNKKVFTGDVNGDGLTDAIYVDGASGSWYTSRGDGSSFHRDDTAWAASFGAGKEAITVDANGDGLTDIGYYEESTGLVRVKFSNGSSQFATEKNWVTFPLTGNGFSFQPGDFNGDGLIDPAIFNATSGKRQIADSDGNPADLLSQLNNGRGGTVSVTYQPSAGVSNKGDDDIADLPIVLPLVSAVATSDGMGSTYTTTYSFMNGVFDSGDREFRGFRDVRVTDAEQNASITKFLQDDIFKGRVENQEVQDGLGNKYSRTENTWVRQNPPPVPGVDFVYLSETSGFTYDGDTTFRRIRSTFQYDAYGNPTQVQEEGEVGVAGDERTRVTEYTYNPSAYIVNRLSRALLYEGLGTGGAKKSEGRFYYDGNVSYTAAPTKGILTKQEEWVNTNNTWLATTMTYDTYGNVATVKDARNFTTTNTFDTTYHIYLTQIQNALGHTRKGTYDARLGQALTATDANGQVVTNTYDALGRLVKVVAPLDSDAYPSATYEYNLSTVPNRVITRQRIQNGQPQTYDTYTFIDGLGRQIQTRLPAESSSQQVVTGSVEFDSRGLVSAQSTPYFDSFSTNYVAPAAALKKATFAYDPVGRRLQTTFPDNTIAQASYQDWVQTTTDPNGHKKESTYDAYGRLKLVKEFNAGAIYQTNYQYDTLGNLTQTTDHLANITTIQYDSLSRKVSMQDPDMGGWSYYYDANGNLTSQLDAKGQAIAFTYDALNRVTQKTGPSLSVTYTYDTGTNGIGRLKQVQDSSGTASFTYDVLGRTTSETKTVNSTPYTVNRSYDAMGRLKTLNYPDGETVTYTYNGLGDVETVIGSQTGGAGQFPYVTNVDYNAAGQITKLTYGNGVSTDYTYNPDTLRLSNLMTQGPGGTLQNLSYTFDNVGNVTQINDARNTATQSFGYDDLNRLTSALGSYGAFTYQYNPIGNMTYKEGRTLNYGGVGKPLHAVTSTSDGYSYNYDANGNMIQKIVSAGGTPTAYTYDVENRLTSVQNGTSGPTTVNITLKPGWNFISLPLVTSGADSNNPSVVSALSGLTFPSQYDQLSRQNFTTKAFEHYVNNSLYNNFTTMEFGKGYQIYCPIPAGGTLTWTVSGTPVATGKTLALKTGYNLIGNPTNQQITVSQLMNNLVSGTDYTQVLRYNKDGIQPPGTVPPPPDFLSLSSTDTVQVGEALYVKLTHDATWNLPTPSSTTTFTYDGDGGRVKKTINGTETLYIGGLYEKTGSSATKYIMFGSQRIAAKDSSGASFYHTDHLGGTNVVTNSTGAQTELLEYKPYGSIQRNEGTQDKEHKFTGQRLDASTGLYYYSARYYDSELGRFIQPDTIVPSPGNPQDFNRYSYANNNPTSNVDPTGHGWFSKFFGILSTVASILFPPLAPALWAVNIGISAYTAVQTGNVLGFVGGLAGGWAFGGLGHDIGLGFASGMGEFGRTFLGGALGGAVEFGISGFGAGFGASLASGESFSDSLRGGGVGAASGAIMGAGIQGSYIAGWQDTLHGYTVPEFGLQQGGLSLQAKDYKAFDRVNSWVKARTQGKSGLFLHGTDEAGYRGINITHSLFEGSSVTLPLAWDSVAKDFAFRLNPREYANFTGMNLPKGEYSALAVGRADYVGTSIGGRAPEYKIRKNLAVSYKNPN